MEGKFELQFEDNEYYLVDGNTNDTVATTDKVLLKKYDGYMKKLSLKNCQAIKNGYDLDELAEDFIRDVFGDKKIEIDLSNGIIISFIKGFKKALEILGDKKFSEEDIKRAFIQGVYTKAEIHRKKEEYIQSLQQTEWDVEILMGTHCRQIDCVDKGELVKSKIVKDGEVPQLDKDGCLILKRK